MAILLSVIAFGLGVLSLSGDRSNNFIVGLTDVSPAIAAPTLWNYTVCAQYPGVVGDGFTTTTATLLLLPLLLLLQVSWVMEPLYH